MKLSLLLTTCLILGGCFAMPKPFPACTMEHYNQYDCDKHALEQERKYATMRRLSFETRWHRYMKTGK